MSRKYTSHILLRISVFILFLISVNLLAGYIAVQFNYPSLFNTKATFIEYAVPLPFTWGLDHIPSMLLFGIPLLFLPFWTDKQLRFFRIISLCSFALFCLELDQKIPFLLFPKIDSLTAIAFSLALRPPNRQENPILVATLKITAILMILLSIVFTYSTWRHLTPTISTTHYANDSFILQSITVNNDYRKEMTFHVDMIKFIPEYQACTLAQSLADDLLTDYPFDKNYDKTIDMTFNLKEIRGQEAPYSIGEISLNNAHKDKRGQFACYLKYRNSVKP